MDDDEAARDLARRENQMRIDARALTGTIKKLERRGGKLRRVLDSIEDPITDSISTQMCAELDALGVEMRSARWALYQLTAFAIGGDYRACDIHAWCDRAQQMGASHPNLDFDLLLDLVHVRKVPNAPFRERLQELTGRGKDELTYLNHTYRHLRDIEGADGCYGAASLMASGKPQPRALHRLLGMATRPTTADRPPSLRLFVSYEQGVALSRALDMEPLQAGI